MYSNLGLLILCRSCQTFPVERKSSSEKQATSEEFYMCLTNGDNNFEKQLNTDSKPCSFKPIFAHLIKVTVTLTVSRSLCQLREFLRVRSSLITPCDVYPH